MKPLSLNSDSHLGTIYFEVPRFDVLVQKVKDVFPFIKYQNNVICYVMIQNNHIFLQTPSGAITPIHPPVLHEQDDKYTQNRFIINMVRALHNLEIHHKSDVTMGDLLSNNVRKPIDVWNLHIQVQNLFVKKRQIHKWVGNPLFQNVGSLVTSLEVDTLLSRTFEYTPKPKPVRPGLFDFQKTQKYTELTYT